MAERAIESILDLSKLDTDKHQVSFRDVPNKKSSAGNLANDCVLPLFVKAQDFDPALPELPAVACPNIQPVIPVIPPPYIPEDLTNPCAGGFNFVVDERIVYSSQISVAKVGTNPAIEYVLFMGTVNPQLTDYYIGEVGARSVLELRHSVATNGTPVALTQGQLYMAYLNSNVKNGSTDTYLSNGKPYVAIAGDFLTSGELHALTRRTIDSITQYGGYPAIKIVSGASDLVATSNYYAGDNVWLRRFSITSDSSIPASAVFNYKKGDTNGCLHYGSGLFNVPSSCPNGIAMETHFRAKAKMGMSAACYLEVQNSPSPTDTSFQLLNVCTAKFKAATFEAKDGEYPQLEVLAINNTTTAVDGYLYKVISEEKTGYAIYNGVSYQDGAVFKGGSSPTISTSGTGVAVHRVGYLQIISTDSANNKFETRMSGDAGFAAWSDFDTVFATASTKRISSDNWGLLYLKIGVGSSSPSKIGFYPDSDDSCQGALAGALNIPSAVAGLQNCSSISFKKDGATDITSAGSCAFDLSSFFTDYITTLTQVASVGNGKYLVAGKVSGSSISLNTRGGSDSISNNNGKSYLHDSEPFVRVKGGELLTDRLQPIVLSKGNATVQSADTDPVGDDTLLTHALKLLVPVYVGGLTLSNPATDPWKEDANAATNSDGADADQGWKLANIALRKYEYCKDGQCKHVLLIGSPLYDVNENGTTDWGSRSKIIG